MFCPKAQCLLEHEDEHEHDYPKFGIWVKLKPPHLLPVYTDGGAGIVPIISPGRVMKMDDEITVVRDYAIAETDLADRLPVSNGLSLALRKENKP